MYSTYFVANLFDALLMMVNSDCLSKRMMTEDNEDSSAPNGPSTKSLGPSSPSRPSSVGSTSVKSEPVSVEDGDKLLMQLREKIGEWAGKLNAVYHLARSID